VGIGEHEVANAELEVDRDARDFILWRGEVDITDSRCAPGRNGSQVADNTGSKVYWSR
jgi:hypothetical protein